MSSLEAAAVARVIDRARAAGVDIPPEVLSMHAKLEHGTDALAAFPRWQEAHPGEEPPPEASGCCYGSAIYGYERCECWEPVYDTEQTDPVLPVPDGSITVRSRRCFDCAFRKGSPERADEYTEDELLGLAVAGTPFWCHEGDDREGRVARWILRRLTESLSLDRSEWATVSFTLGDGIRRAMAASASAAGRSSSTDSPRKSRADRSRPASSSCTDATTRPASHPSISDAGACLTTTLTWLRRGGLTELSETATPTPDSPTGRFLLSVAGELMARRCDPWRESSASATATSVDSADRCDALFDTMRRPRWYEHPVLGRVRASGDDWRPPQVAGVPFRRDGSPGLLCAGWASEVARQERLEAGA